LGHLAFCYDWVTYRLKALKLHLQKPFNHVVFFYWRNFDGDLHLSLFSLSYLEPHLLKVLEPLIASDRKNILIQVIEFLVAALGNDSEHERIVGTIVFKNLIFQFDNDINFLDGSGEESGFTEGDTVPIDVDEVFGFGELCGALRIFLR
jgi:hypothetical protein